MAELAVAVGHYFLTKQLLRAAKSGESGESSDDEVIYHEALKHIDNPDYVIELVRGIKDAKTKVAVKEQLIKYTAEKSHTKLWWTLKYQV